MRHDKLEDIGTWGGLWVWGGLCGLFGCALDSQEAEAGPESVGVTAEAARTTTFATDASGTISISVTQCDAITGSGVQATACPVPSGYALVGGGVEILDSPNPGALLTATVPDFGNQRWIGRAKDHIVTQTYSVRAMAIGLKLTGVSASSLRGMMSFTSQSLSGSGTLGQTVTVPAGHVVLGGSAESSHTTPQRRFLTTSAPVCNNDPHDSCASAPVTGWLGQTKDHIQGAEGFVIVGVLSIPECPVGFSGCLNSDVAHASVNSSTGYQSAWVQGTGTVTGIGAFLEWAGDGRMLTDLWARMRPNGLVRAYADSKDHERPSSGSTIVYALSLKKR
jgi:hypothetical protein